MKELIRSVIYARVSKAEEGIQDPYNQITPLKKMAESLSYDLTKIYIDRASGGDSNRPSFQEMLDDARHRRFKVVLIWSLDRISREGMIQTLSYIKTLEKNGICIKSLQESWLDTSDKFMGQLLIAIFSWVAQQERRRISERVKAGLKKAKNVGKRGKDKRPRKRTGYLLRYANTT